MARTLVDANRRRGLLHLAYMRQLDRRFRLQPDPRAAADCSDLFDGVQRIAVRPLRQRFVHRFPPDAIAQIRELDLDVILRFGFNIIRGDILHAARHGVWSFHHGDSERYRGGPALLWELMEGSPLSGAVLQRLDETLDAGPVLSRGILATSRRPYVSRNRYNVYWSTQHFVIQKLHELHQYGPQYVERRTTRCGPYLGKRPIYRTPTNVEMARWLVPTMAKTARRRLSAQDEVLHWRICLRRSSPPLYRQPQSATPGQCSWIDCPRGSFQADPFLIEEGGETWLFFENFSYAERRAVIACGKVEDGQLKEVRTALEPPHHLSYPYVFRHDGAIWMVPESAAVRQVRLYRARRFPDDWVLERTLLDLRAVDCSPFEFRGRWWMFVSPVVVNGHVPSTLLFVAPQPWGPWKLHPADCICGDVRRARCAGAIIRDGDRLIRPSQDCSTGYGRSISFNEVSLSDTTYEERPCGQLLPDFLSGFDGVHTYARAGAWEAIDARAMTPRGRIF
jgi:hypothetical protein